MLSATAGIRRGSLLSSRIIVPLLVSLHPSTTTTTIESNRIVVATMSTALSPNSSNTSTPVQESITQKLTTKFDPSHLEVTNESHKHNVPKNSETHFKVIIVSSQFDSMKSLLQRHRAVNEVLHEELQNPVHALSIVAKTPTQWQTMQENNISVPPSPNCRGGDGTLDSKK